MLDVTIPVSFDSRKNQEVEETFRLTEEQAVKLLEAYLLSLSYTDRVKVLIAAK